MRGISEIDAKSSWSIITGIPKKLLGSTQGSFRFCDTEEISVEFKNSGSEWTGSIPISSNGLHILQLYGPLALKDEWIIGQIGQSLDGKIATCPEENCSDEGRVSKSRSRIISVLEE